MKACLLSTVAVVGGIVGFTGTAAAQPMPRIPVAAQPYQWTGCYIGAQAGWGWGDAKSRSLDLTTDVDGGLAGGQIGCDYQFAPNFLVGIEAMAAWTDIGGKSDPFFSGKNVTRFSTQTDWIASATARAGVTADRWVLYVKGGAAWSNGDYRQFGFFCPLGCPAFAIPFDGRGSETEAGWTWGLGIEWAFAPNWSTKLEFNQYRFDDIAVRLRDRFSGSPGRDIFDLTINTVTFGINYRFATGRQP
jgi:outer membrane immunogenic protein